ncbi:aldehyde dehydrogenase [Novosphingobium nitrogenifigens DSM 19370]|uniref:Aldehyde dehydrogenase n=1 Tax=Novosphingobium nitrogenifigens DSM 19370 TaxID=983920 RepID=F1Z7U3_9SPHN|nr:aldehyde dehydrogenase [Novosphingobium nitrogenifigens]EGD59282.1 aldehyde dehydrogenase [Novosphingobium nitrogenifigens DSM 19370]
MTALPTDVSPLAVIGASRRAASDGAVLPTINPATGTVLAELPACGAVEIDEAVSVARARFEAGSWRDMAPRQRKAVMLRVADGLAARAEDFALLETLESGKPISDTRAVDVPLALNTLRYYAEAIDKIHGEVGPSGPDRLSWAVHDPLGVIGAIVPWNFPLHMAMWKIAPAIAMGNSVVVKPSELTSLTTLHFAAVALEAGLPEGVLNIVPGTGALAGSALARHNDVDMITFTGSGPVGRQLMHDAADSNLKRVSLELGGKSPHIVFADYPDLDRVAEAAAWGIFYNQGQVCTAGSRLLVERSIHADFVARLVKVAETIRPGNPLDPATRLGAVISEKQMNGVLHRIAGAQREGADLILGGRQALKESGGFFLEPTIFDHVAPTSALAREEVFGPVLAVIPFDTPEEALHLANDTEYGLASGLWTGSMALANRFARQLRAGLVWINGWDACDITMPFGGFKQSGFGRDRSLHALYKYADLKSISVSFPQ